MLPFGRSPLFWAISVQVDPLPRDLPARPLLSRLDLDWLVLYWGVPVARQQPPSGHRSADELRPPLRLRSAPPPTRARCSANVVASGFSQTTRATAVQATPSLRHGIRRNRGIGPFAANRQGIGCDCRAVAPGCFELKDGLLIWCWYY